METQADSEGEAIKETKEKADKVVITLDNLTKYIGQPLHLSDRLYPFGTPAGVVMGLAWTSLGGASLFIEARGRLPGGSNRSSDAQVTVSGGDESERRVGGGGIGGPM